MTNYEFQLENGHIRESERRGMGDGEGAGVSDKCPRE